MHQDHPNGRQFPSRFGLGGLDEAYDRCGVVTASYAKTFYLGTQLMTPEKAKAVWAVYVWCRRTDELVDGPNASRITPEVETATFSRHNSSSHLTQSAQAVKLHYQLTAAIRFLWQQHCAMLLCAVLSKSIL